MAWLRGLVVKSRWTIRKVVGSMPGLTTNLTLFLTQLTATYVKIGATVFGCGLFTTLCVIEIHNDWALKEVFRGGKRMFVTIYRSLLIWLQNGPKIVLVASH